MGWAGKGVAVEAALEAAAAAGWVAAGVAVAGLAAGVVVVWAAAGLAVVDLAVEGWEVAADWAGERAARVVKVAAESTGGLTQGSEPCR